MRNTRFLPAPGALACSVLLAVLATATSASGAPLGMVTEFTVGGRPEGITVGHEGDLWFTNYGDYGQIGRITPTGMLTSFTEFPGNPGGVTTAITTGTEGNLWFAEDERDAIGRITPTGAITEFVIPGGSDAKGITVGPEGNLWFTAFYTDTIGRMTPTGAVTEFPIPAGGGEPWAITRGPEGDLWFTMLEGNGVGRITPTGTVTEFPIVASRAITAGPDGNLWFPGSGEKIVRMTPTGTVTEFSTGLTEPDGDGITAGPDGNLWFLALAHIGRITPTGTVTEFPIESGVAYPQGITPGPEGNVWFTEYGSSAIGRIGTSVTNYYSEGAILPEGVKTQDVEWGNLTLRGEREISCHTALGGWVENPVAGGADTDATEAFAAWGCVANYSCPAGAHPGVEPQNLPWSGVLEEIGGKIRDKNQGMKVIIGCLVPPEDHVVGTPFIVGKQVYHPLAPAGTKKGTSSLHPGFLEFDGGSGSLEEEGSNGRVLDQTEGQLKLLGFQEQEHIYVQTTP